MRYITVGSRALDYFGITRRPPKDFDLWVDSEDHCLEGDISIMPKEIMDLVPTENGYATPDAIYTIKLSHAAYDIFWQKTKNDILWLKEKGCKLIIELYTVLLEHWKGEHGDKDFLSLNKTKEDFFTDNVTYVYDHDYLHKLVAYPDRPIYERVLKDNHQVLVDKSKFEELPFETRVRMFREEITVIAAERWLINPHWSGKISWRKAYGLSLQKTVTALTKGWATEFILMNLEHFVKPDYNYFKYLMKTIEETKEMGIKVQDLNLFQGIADDSGLGLDYTLFLLSGGDTCEIGVWRDHLSYDENKEARDKYLEDLGYEHLEQEGGGEGGSEYCYGVFKLKGIIYKADYNYYSHYGHDYDSIKDSLQIVEAKEKTVTVYE